MVSTNTATGFKVPICYAFKNLISNFYLLGNKITVGTNIFYGP